jgi:outer membrane protein assembly factor BamD (BamD/ComL family)
MKKIFLIFAIVFVSLSINAQERRFQKALEENSVIAFDNFIKKYPKSEFTEEATFKRASLINESDAFEEFVRKYPEGNYTARALDLWSNIEYIKVQKLNTIEGYEKFLKLFPNSQFSEQVERYIENQEFDAAKEKNKILDYLTFINKYPGGIYTNKAIDLWSNLEFEKSQTINSVTEFEVFWNSLSLYKFGEKVKQYIIIKEFDATKKKSTITAYQRFIDLFPECNYTLEAKNAIIEKEFQIAKEKKSFEAFDTFFENNPAFSVKYFDIAINSLEKTQQNNIASMNFTNSKFSNYAKGYCEKSRSETILNSYDIKELEAFIRDYPKSKSVELAKNRINSINLKTPKLGENIFDLVSENKVEVEVKGSDITGVTVSVRKLVPNNINVQIPPGTFFISNSSSSQNMVTRRNKNIVLVDNKWHDYNIEAGCANRIRDIPGADDRFNVQRSPNQQELEILMKVLSKENTSSKVEQAAIWVVTDNADYNDLGILVMRSTYSYYGGTRRVLNQYEAARAMQICVKAGINIKGKAIWQDKEEILNGLENTPLKTWLKTY